jgi:hypothetical protein
MITKEMILERITQEEIMDKYYPGDVILEQKVTNAMRKDRNPDCSFHYSSGKLLFIDFAYKQYNGDCWKIAILNTKIDFPEILYKIDSDFELNLQPKGFHQKTKPIKYKIEPIIVEKEFNKIEYEAMDWTKFDIKYWGDRGISLSTLKYFNVETCHRVWLSKSKEIFTYHPRDPIYKYLIRDPDIMEIYRPYGTKKVKFRSNCPKNILQGWYQLPETGDILIITKAYKDIMNFYEMGYPAVSFNGESTFPDLKIFEMLKKRFKKIVVVYDNDKPGITAAKRINEVYGLPYWYIPLKYNIKDTNDFILNYGYDDYKKIFIPDNIGIVK